MLQNEVWTAGAPAGIVARVSFDRLRVTRFSSSVILSLSKGDVSQTQTST